MVLLCSTPSLSSAADHNIKWGMYTKSDSQAIKDRSSKRDALALAPAGGRLGLVCSRLAPELDVLLGARLSRHDRFGGILRGFKLKSRFKKISTSAASGDLPHTLGTRKNRAGLGAGWQVHDKAHACDLRAQPSCSRRC